MDCAMMSLHEHIVAATASGQQFHVTWRAIERDKALAVATLSRLRWICSFHAAFVTLRRAAVGRTNALSACASWGVMPSCSRNRSDPVAFDQRIRASAICESARSAATRRVPCPSQAALNHALHSQKRRPTILAKPPDDLEEQADCESFQRGDGAVCPSPRATSSFPELSHGPCRELRRSGGRAGKPVV